MSDILELLKLIGEWTERRSLRGNGWFKPPGLSAQEISAWYAGYFADKPGHKYCNEF